MSLVVWVPRSPALNERMRGLEEILVNVTNYCRCQHNNSIVFRSVREPEKGELRSVVGSEVQRRRYRAGMTAEEHGVTLRGPQTVKAWPTLGCRAECGTKLDVAGV